MTSTLISFVACTILAPCPTYDGGPARLCIPTATAEPCLRNVLDRLRRDPATPPPHLIWALERLSIFKMNQGDWEQARPLIAEAFERSLKMTGPPHPAQAEAAGMLAAFHRRQGEPARALPLLRRSLALDQQIFGDSDPHSVPVLVELGTLLVGEGRETEAAKLFDRAGRIIGTAKMDWSREQLLLDLGLAELAMRQKHFEDANRRYRAALHHPSLDDLSRVHVHAALASIARAQKDKETQRAHREQGIALARTFPHGADLVRSIFGGR